MKISRSDYISSPIDNIYILRQIIKKNAIIFDIGACEGEDSIKYALEFKNSKVYAFEPIPENFKLAQNNISKYNCNNVKVFELAISDSNGIAEFYVSEGAPEDIDVSLSDWDFGNKSSSLLEPGLHKVKTPWIKFSKKIVVKTKALITFLMDNQIDEIDFLHLDVQGAEVKVLEGAGLKLKNIKAIWLEVSDIELYKNQPLKENIERFMIQNKFKLIVSDVKYGVGDQLYINKKYFFSINILGKVFVFKKYF